MAYLHVTYTHTECKPVYLFAIQFSSYPAISHGNKSLCLLEREVSLFCFPKKSSYHYYNKPWNSLLRNTQLNCSLALTYLPIRLPLMEKYPFSHSKAPNPTAAEGFFWGERLLRLLNMHSLFAFHQSPTGGASKRNVWFLSRWLKNPLLPSPARFSTHIWKPKRTSFQSEIFRFH